MACRVRYIKKLLLALLFVSLPISNVFAQAIRVPTLEVLIGSSTVGKRVEQLDLPASIFTGTASGKRVTLTAKDFVSKIHANGTDTTGAINIVVTGEGTSTTTYDPITNTGTLTLNFTSIASGTETPTAGWVVKSYTGTSTIDQDWLAPVFGYIYRTTTKTIQNGTWTTVEMDTDNGELYNATHTAVGSSSIKVLKGGLFEAEGFVSSRGGGGSVGIRLCKNTGIEIPGSWAMNYQNYGDGNTSDMLKTPKVQFRLGVNDYVYMQIEHNFGSDQEIIGYSLLGDMLPPTGSCTAGISLKKIGE